jgi:hypothetical protein
LPPVSGYLGSSGGVERPLGAESLFGPTSAGSPRARLDDPGPLTERVPAIQNTKVYGEPSRSGRSGRVVLVGFLVVLLVAAVIGIAALLPTPDTSEAATTGGATTPVSNPAVVDDPPTTTSPPSPAVTDLRPARITAVTTYIPSDPAGEHNDLIAKIFDGNATTDWYTYTYKAPNFAGLKPGVGLVVTLDGTALVTQVVLETPAGVTGGMVEIRQPNPSDQSAGTVLASGSVAGGRTVFTLDNPTELSSVVVWVSDLPKVSDGYRLNVYEISVQ